ncbi:MAG: prepilin-type N-terminal cleavage/methylation domain-containing protein [Lachnospiraceae bacterium]|nr:prepilin-type N-terminal cleavage/methylation domain-containing protein [Lachnospiraceae bacterium]
MRNKRQSKHSKNQNNGFTLVELVVSMALTAILATAVASIMFPVVSIFMDMQKLSRAQMVADIVTDALRKECAASFVEGPADVRVFTLSSPSGGLTAAMKTQMQGYDLLSGTSGNTLLFRVNYGYAKAIFWNNGLSVADYNEVLEGDAKDPKTSNVTSRAIYRLFPAGTTGELPTAAQAGYLHYGYYKIQDRTVTREEKDIHVFDPTRAYDYTNPFSSNAYNGFTISVEYSDLKYETVKAGSAIDVYMRPVSVVATVKVYEGGKEQSDDTLVYSRKAVLCFAEDNKRVTE